MKCRVTAGALLALATAVVNAGETCVTHYASTSTSRVPTHTKSIKTTTTQTYVFYNDTVYSTSTWTVIADSTVTIPTGTSFTPIIDAPTNRPTGHINEAREASNTTLSKAHTSTKPSSSKHTTTSSPTPTRFPHSVDCTTATSTISASTTTYMTDYLTADYLTTVEFHSTTHVPTATAYAACAPGTNLIDRFHGVPVNYVAALAYRNLCSNGTGTFGQQACASPRQCCEAAQSEGDSGFAWTANATGTGPFTGIACFAMTEWSFDVGNDVQAPMWIGNGPEGSGIWGSVA